MCFYEIGLSAECLKKLLGNGSLTLEEMRCANLQTKRFVQTAILNQLKRKP